MSDFNLLAATRTLEQSMAFAVYRFLLCFGIGLGYLFAALAGAGTVVGFASLAKNAGALGPWGAVLGFAAFGLLMYKTRPFWLHAVKAPHLALLAAQAKGETLPSGRELVDFAKQRVARSFPSATALFELDRNGRRALAGIAESASAAVIPLGNPQLKKVLSQAFGTLYSRNQQSILAWHFYSGADDFEKTAAAALEIQKRHYATLLNYRLYASLFEVLGFLIAFPVLLMAFEKIVAAIPIDFGIWPAVFASVFGWTLKAAFFEPIAEAAVMVSFFGLTGKSV